MLPCLLLRRRFRGHPGGFRFLGSLLLRRRLRGHPGGFRFLGGLPLRRLLLGHTGGFRFLGVLLLCRHLLRGHLGSFRLSCSGGRGVQHYASDLIVGICDPIALLRVGQLGGVGGRSSRQRRELALRLDGNFGKIHGRIPAHARRDYHLLFVRIEWRTSARIRRDHRGKARFGRFREVQLRGRASTCRGFQLERGGRRDVGVACERRRRFRILGWMSFTPDASGVRRLVGFDTLQRGDGHIGCRLVRSRSRRLVGLDTLQRGGGHIGCRLVRSRSRRLVGLDTLQRGGGHLGCRLVRSRSRRLVGLDTLQRSGGHLGCRLVTSRSRRLVGLDTLQRSGGHLGCRLVRSRSRRLVGLDLDARVEGGTDVHVDLARLQSGRHGFDGFGIRRLEAFEPQRLREVERPVAFCAELDIFGGYGERRVGFGLEDLFFELLHVCRLLCSDLGRRRHRDGILLRLAMPLERPQLQIVREEREHAFEGGVFRGLLGLQNGLQLNVFGRRRRVFGFVDGRVDQGCLVCARVAVRHREKCTGERIHLGGSGGPHFEVSRVPRPHSLDDLCGVQALALEGLPGKLYAAVGCEWIRLGRKPRHP